MNDHKKEETMLPDWMCSGETYVPSKDKEAFLTKSTKSVLSVLAKMRFYEGKDGKFSATPSLKLFYTLLYIVLTACSGNYLFTLIMCAAVTVRLAFFSAKAIRQILRGKTTVVAGPSGVGKSSITNCMQGEIQMETGEISRKLKRGKHTTRHSQVIPVEKDTFLVDTPGFSSLYLTDMEEDELRNYFPEFLKYEPQCRFQGCRHIHEPDCGVKEALAEGKISQLRYEDYLALYEELKEKRRY